MPNGRLLPTLTSILALAALAATAPALANDRQKTAQRAVVDLIEGRFGRTPRIVFQSTQGGLGRGEERVTGKGYFSEGRGGRDFTYSVRVRDGGEARDAVVQVEGGNRLTNEGNWFRPNGRDTNGNRRDDRRNDPFGNGRNGNGRNGNGRDGGLGRGNGNRLPGGRPVERPGLPGDRNGASTRAIFTNPEPGFDDQDGEVTFAGEGIGARMTLRIYDERGREVTSRAIEATDGRWETKLRLEGGRYRATVGNSDYRGGGRRDEDTVNFSVRYGSDSFSGRDEDRVIVSSPRRDETVRDSRVRFEGTSVERQVTLEIFDGTRRVYRQDLRVDRGRWSADVRLDRDRRFRFTVKSESGKDLDESFVRTAR